MKILTFLLVFGVIFPISAQKKETKPSANRSQVSLETILKNKTTDYVVTHEHTSSASGIHHQYIRQVFNGLEIYGTESSMHYGKTGETILSHSKFVNIDEVSANRNTNGIGEQQAIRSVASQMGYRLSNVALVPAALNNTTKKFSAPSISSVEIPVKKMYYFQEEIGIQLIYELSIADITSSDWYNFRVDATTGQIIDKDNWTAECNMTEAHNEHFHNNTASKKSIEKVSKSSTYATVFTKEESMANTMLAGSYNVYAMPTISPDHGGRSIVMNPDNAIASPFGWHDTNGAPGAEFTNTIGNNVYAQDDINGNNGTDGYSPDGGASLNFDFPIDLTMNPNQNLDPIITNLFYWNNIVHDVTYLYGFDEVSGNFQENNYTALGIGGDSVNADAQDTGNCNANFGTPPDGFNPRMQMYTCNLASPEQDSSLDNPVIVHEYAHGISNRLTGGAGTTSCLGNSEQMGEGWSDIYGLLLTMQTGDLATDSRPVGTYLLGQPVTGPGVRTFPYDIDLADNPHTYDDIKGTTTPHAVGQVWAMMLWEMTWELIDDYGYSSDFYDNTGTAGNIVALNLITEGLKLQPCQPGFVDGRDAILAADMALYGGANQCIIWDAFAKRGLGFSADQGSTSDRNDGTEAFDLPPTFGGFSTVDEICLADGIQNTLGGGTPEGGEYSGTGVTDNGDGITYSFDPSVPGSGNTTVTYTVTDPCSLIETMYNEIIEVTDTPPVIVCYGSGTQTEMGTITENPSLPIPDNGDPVGVSSVIAITDSFNITDLNIDIDITHTWVGDLTVTLTSPAMTTVVLFDGDTPGGAGCSGDDLTFTFDDEGVGDLSDCTTGVNDAYPEATYVPHNLLSAFDGEDSAGNWTLLVTDDFAQDTGTLNSWGLTYSYDVDLAPVDVTLDPSGTKTINVEDLVYSVDVDCGGYTVTDTDSGLSTVTFDTSDEGLTNVNITVTNDVGTSSTCVGVANVILSTIISNVEVVSGDVMITDVDDRDDDITIVIDGLNYRVTDLVNGLVAGVGTTQDGPNSVLIPIASITGEIIVNTMGGDDTFTTNFSGGNFTDAITYNGGSQISAPGDMLILSGGPTFTGVTHNFETANDGNVEVTGNSLLTYTGLEPVVDNVSAMDRVFNFTGGSETITLDAGGTLDNQIDSTLGESVDFNNPMNSLTINTEIGGGTGADLVNVEGLAAGFDADLIVNGGVDDIVSFQTNPTAVDTGNIMATGQDINVFNGLSTSGTGTIDLIAQRKVLVFGSFTIATVDGDITMEANLANTTNTSVNTAVDIGRASVSTGGTGNIVFEGNGFSDTGGTNFVHGVRIRNSASIQTIGAGSISMTGIGADGNLVNDGVRIQDTGTIIRSSGGGISLNGTGGTNSGPFNIGVSLETGATVEDVADGDITIMGIGGTGTNANRGVEINSASTLRVNNGNLSIDGTGGNGTGNDNQGILVLNGSTVSAIGTGFIDMTGLGGGGANAIQGVRIQDAGTVVSTIDGDITFNGTSGSGTGFNNEGVDILFGARVEATGAGAIDFTGTSQGGISANKGIVTYGTGSTVRTNGGGITMTGQGGIAATGNFNLGISIESGSLIQDLDSGNILLTGIGGMGAQVQRGITLSSGNIIANGGDITFNGTGGNGTGGFQVGTSIFDNSQISTNGTGSISIFGTGGSGTGGNYGSEVFGANTQVSAENGTIQIDGFAPDASEGNRITAEIVTTGSGDIILNGSTTNSSVAAINIFEDTGTITAGGDIIATAIIGEIHTTTGVPTTTIFTATETNINGVIAPGQSPGQVTVSGDFTMAADDTYEVEVDDFNNFGTDYDQIAVTGMVDVTGATLTLVDNTTESGELCDEMIIIDNDDTDTIIGEFAGASEGTDISFNGELWRISYVGGDGNDVVLAFNPGMVAAPICMDITLQLDANGNPITITPADVDGGTPMGCDFESLSIDMDTFDCSNVGPNDVTLTVTDIFGNMNTCTAIVTVEDVTPPVIGCPANLIASTDDDSCTAVVVFAQPSVIDNCSAAGDIIITQVTGIPSGGTFPQGVNQVGFSATDEAGNVSFCSFTITVEDNTDPVAVCMDATVTLDNTGNATITPAAVNGGSTDNCGILSSSVDITSFTCADIGPNTVILTVTDINGNTDTCEAIVMVVDTTAPVAVCQDITVELGPDGTVTIDGSLMDDGSSDSCGAGTLTFTTDPAVLSCSDIGQRFVDLIVTDESGNSSTCTAIVTVEDNLDPVLVCQDTTIELGPDGTATVDPMALLDMTNPLDNCGIDVLSVDVTEVNCNDVGGTIAITVFASDNAGNFSSCVATVTVVDTSGPVFDQASLPQGPLTRLIDPATGFYRLEDFRVGVSSTDNCSEGLLPISVSQTPFAGTPLTEGTYDITITAMDEAGNETDHVFVLIVEPALGVGDNELTLSTLTMYPNPASDKVILSNPQNIQLRDIQVYDLTGRLVQKVDLSETLLETLIDVSKLQSATYMFIISTDKASITKQIIKE